MHVTEVHAGWGTGNTQFALTAIAHGFDIRMKVDDKWVPYEDNGLATAGWLGIVIKDLHDLRCLAKLYDVMFTTYKNTTKMMIDTLGGRFRQR